MEFVRIPHDYVDHYWQTVEPMLKKAVDFSGGRYDTEHLLKELLTGFQQLWIMHDDGEIKSAITTKVIEYPLCSFISIIFLGGEEFISSENVDLFYEDLKKFGQSFGCCGIEFTGRPGWTRVTRNHGFKERYRVSDRRF